MLKKIFISMLLCIGMAYASGTGTINMTVNSNQWNLVSPNDNSIHVIYLPADLELSTLQSSLADGQTLIIYNLAAYPDWMKQFTDNVPFVAAIKVTSTGITYLTLVDGVQKSFDSYVSFESYINSQNFTETSGFSLDDYLSYFTKLKAGGLYYIKSSGTDLKFNINFGSSTSGTAGQSGGTGGLSSGTGTINMTVNSNQWNLVSPNDNSIHVIYLPADLELSTLQSSLADGQTLIIYNLAAYPDWMKQFTDNVPFVAAIKVTSTGITYLTLVDGVQKSFDSYVSFESYINSQNFTETSGFSLDDYLSYFTKLKAGGLYYIKSSGTDLKFNINFGSSTSSSEGSSSSSGLEMPPNPPDLGSSSSDGSGLDMPPVPPTL